MKAVVTGASSGVGAALAEDLLARGYRVTLVARRAHRLATLVDRYPDLTVAVAADMADPATARTAYDATALRPGDRLVLVNAAGVCGPIAPAGETDLAEWRQTVDVNLLGPVAMTEAFLPHMIRTGWGRIVNVSSAQALHPPAGLVAAYATTKVALNFYTRCVAEQVAGTEVAAIAIHPGDVWTEIWEHIGARADRLGPDGQPLRELVSRIEAAGGDPPSRVVDLLRRLVDEPAAVHNGQFRYIEDGIQAPLPVNW
ncbi:SDR family NAD(P)-dependent oxidoreductase [Dactylosporangium sp. NPDC048998]|uniref:SDR family NAD(P)-dependent oxidoreductase n=1 Tax=Dactylosporangium sp. NPDC048998 TaxID=3363976 RepID=UPI00371A4D3D